jgi:tetratricopeptide (TPR) repeat protein
MNHGNSNKNERGARAVAEVEAALERTAKRYPADLPACHYARRAGWCFDTHRAPDGFAGFLPGAFGQPESLRHQLEIARAHAEALLVADRLGEVMLGARQREELTIRALGILPSAEAERMREVFACRGLQPRFFAHSSVATLAAYEQIEHELGRGTALTYCMLTVAGQSKEDEIAGYGARLDQVFDRLVSAPAVARALDASAPGDGLGPFEAQFALLLAVREQLWHMKPNRVSTEFLLTRVINGYLGSQNGAGDSLGLALFDSIILGKLGFRANYLIQDGVFRLQVPVPGGSVFWELTDHSPLSQEPVVDGRTVDLPSLFATTYKSLAAMCSSHGLWDRSVEAYQRTLELDPDSAETRTSLAVCFLHKQAADEAIRELRACLQLDPNAPEVHHQLGNAYAMQLDWPKAIDSFKRALRIKPGMAEVYNNLGFAYINTGNRSQAVAAFETAIEHRADYYQAHFNLANLHLERQDYDLAIKHYRETLRIEPELVAAHYNMGRAQYEKHDLDAAIHCYQKAVALNPKHFGAWYNLGIAYRDQGQTEKAVESLEKAVTINPNLMR